MQQLDIKTARNIIAELVFVIGNGKLTPNCISAIMTKFMKGSDADGAWDWRQAQDLMQAAALQMVCARKSMASAPTDAVLAQLQHTAQSLPTETRRSERQMLLQQFSTPLPYAWLAVSVNGSPLTLLIMTEYSMRDGRFQPFLWRCMEMAAKRRSPREYGDDFKCQIVSESYEAGASVSDLSRHHDVPTRQIYTWRSDVRYQPNNCGDRDVRFLEVAVEPAPSTLSVESIHGRERIEITLENGRRLSVSDGVNAEFVLELARGLAA